MIKINFKKFFIIIITSVLLFTSVFVKPKEVEGAFPLAIPAVAGALALGATAIATVGIETYNYFFKEDDFGLTQWEKSRQAVKDTFIGAWSWVNGDLKFNSDAVDISQRDINYIYNTSFYYDGLKRNYSAELSERYSPVVGEYTTNYPDVYIEYELINDRPISTIYPGQDKVFFVSDDTGFYISETLVVSRVSNQWKVAIRDYYRLRNDLRGPYNNLNIVDVYYRTNLHSHLFVDGYLIKYDLLLDYIESSSSIDYSVSIISSDVANNILERYQTNDLPTYEGIDYTIPRQVIEYYNPGITYDDVAGYYVDQVGQQVDTRDLAIPFPEVYEKEGTLELGIPLDDSFADVKTGEIVQADPVEDAPPGTGLIRSIYNFLMDILERILNAIKAIPGAITSVLNAIKDLVQSILNAIGEIILFLHTLTDVRALITALTDMFVDVFIPNPDNFYSRFDELRNLFNSKLPIIASLGLLFSSFNGSEVCNISDIDVNIMGVNATILKYEYLLQVSSFTKPIMSGLIWLLVAVYAYLKITAIINSRGVSK